MASRRGACAFLRDACFIVEDKRGDRQWRESDDGKAMADKSDGGQMSEGQAITKTSCRIWGAGGIRK